MFARALILIMASPAGFQVAPQPELVPLDPVIVPVDTIVAAMQREASRGYDVVPVPNAARFFAGVVLDLARRAHAQDRDGRPLKLRYSDWFSAFLDVADLSPDEAPIAKKIAFENHQDVYIDYDRSHVFEDPTAENDVDVAVNIELSWPDTPGAPDRFSFFDTTSVPQVRVTNHRLIRFRLLDLGDMIVYDDIHGMTGRPATGILAALFELIGEGSLKWSRLAETDEGLLIGRAKAKKSLFSVTETVTVFPDGTAQKGLPEDSPELEAIEERLKEDLQFDYRDW